MPVTFDTSTEEGLALLGFDPGTHSSSSMVGTNVRLFVHRLVLLTVVAVKRLRYNPIPPFTSTLSRKVFCPQERSHAPVACWTGFKVAEVHEVGASNSPAPSVEVACVLLAWYTKQLSRSESVWADLLRPHKLPAKGR
ncbi:hypothetical protein IAQ61_005741 [Plenodomus lingam]|uniref:uncharacterized protein n=1 Tax=Leptosphaeria maculans TaxID=5022 RepID=UPI00331DB7A7|nr:hypothetical protein IAQ61_005741 [Plenodomus lingam]